jgi:hypothetical protein
MRNVNRKTSPKVIGGLTQKKNKWAFTDGYYDTEQPFPVIDRKRLGKGYRHLLKQKDVYDFISILPDWNELSFGLNAIVLAPGSEDTFGYHYAGVVHICAWDENIWCDLSDDGYEAERYILERLGVACEAIEGGMLCKFTEQTARAHQLLATLLHELGHHHDRMSTKSKFQTARGEAYAIEYAKNYSERIWTEYQETFGVF